MDTATTQMAVPPEVQALKDKLKELVRYASASRLKIHASADIVETRELDASFVPGRILANNMVFILVSGDAVRVTFKTHFNLRTAKHLAFRVFGGTSPADITERQAIDYFKEYGNLTAGSVVTLFEKIGIDLGISLPLCTRGFYEVFSDYTEKQNPIVAYSDFWQLHVEGHDVFCSALLEILDKKRLASLADFVIEEEESSDDDEIDFL